MLSDVGLGTSDKAVHVLVEAVVGPAASPSSESEAGFDCSLNPAMGDDHPRRKPHQSKFILLILPSSILNGTHLYTGTANGHSISLQYHP